MSLPAAFATPTDYFKSCVQLLQQHGWIYREANTCFLQADVLSNFTAEERDYFTHIDNEQLNAFPLVDSATLLPPHAPQTLCTFRERLRAHIPDEAFRDAEELCDTLTHDFKKMNLKKQHEVQRLAQNILQLCDKQEVLIDFGAGLGYLSEMLYRRNTDFLILGLEADEQRVEAARSRQIAKMPTARAAIVYKQLLIEEQSGDCITQSVQQMLRENARDTTSSSCTIIGLHACADLTVTAMRLFAEMNAVHRLIIMPCCYHKMQQITATSAPQNFVNFPLSQSLQQALQEATPQAIENIFNRPFLRLACQQTLARWCCSSSAQHATHGAEMWQRAVAEAIREPHEVVVKLKRKHDDANNVSQLTFEALSQCYELRSKLDATQSLSWQPHHARKFEALIEKYPAGAKLAEALTCLQTTMQKLCENIVLYDRLCYLEEYGAVHNLKLKARFVKLMNEKLSPRCYCLIAEKLS